MQRVVGGQLATSTVGDVVDHARGEQLVDQVHLGVRLERRDAERLRQRDGAEQQSCRFAQRAEADLDQLRQSRRRADRTEQHPLAPRFGQHAGLLQAGDQLTQVEQVAARRVAQRRRGHAVDAAGHHTVEQTGHRTQRQRFQVDAAEQLVAPEHRDGLGDGLPRPQRHHQVGASTHRQVQQQRRRSVVERVHVVDEQRQPGIAVEIAEQVVDRRTQPRRRVGPIGEPAERERLGERPQRHRRRRPGRPDAHDARGVREAHHLFGQPGLAHTRRAHQQHATGGGHRAGSLQLGLSPHQRPGSTHVETVSTPSSPGTGVVSPTSHPGLSTDYSGPRARRSADWSSWP